MKETPVYPVRTRYLQGNKRRRETPDPGGNWQVTGLAKLRYRAAREVATSVHGIFKALGTAKQFAVT